MVDTIVEVVDNKRLDILVKMLAAHLAAGSDLDRGIY